MTTMNELKISDTFVLAALRMAGIKPCHTQLVLGRYYETFNKLEAEPIVEQYKNSPFKNYAHCVESVQSTIWAMRHKK